MKKLISLLAFLIIVINLYGQKTTDDVLDSDYLWQKSKNQNTAGKILLVTGTTMTVVGIIGFGNNSMSFDDGILKGGNAQKADAYGYIMLAGLVMDLASIPVFIFASRNKKRAARLGISNQLIYKPINSLLVLQKQSIPTLILRISF
jgi:hypothetical protein